MGRFLLGKREVTDPDMTRFWVTPKYAATLALEALCESPGVMLVSDTPAYRVGDLAMAVNSAPIKEVGMRPGEKMHETILTAAEAIRTVKTGKWYKTAPLLVCDERIDYNKDKLPTIEERDVTSADKLMTVEEIKALLSGEGL